MRSMSLRLTYME